MNTPEATTAMYREQVSALRRELDDARSAITAASQTIAELQAMVCQMNVTREKAEDEYRRIILEQAFRLEEFKETGRL